MRSGRITKNQADGLLPKAVEYVKWDALLRGFGVRVRPSGSKSFIALYRTGGRNAPVRKVTIGTYGKLTVEQARTEAGKILARAELGHDTAAEKAKLRADITVGDLADLYLAEGCERKKSSSILNDRSRIKNHVKPLLGNRPAGGVAATDIEKVMRDIAAGKTARDIKTGKKGRSIVRGGRGAATQTVRLLSVMFSFAQKRGLRPDNPAAGVQKYAGGRSERFLTSNELGTLGVAIREAETTGIPWDVDVERATAKHLAKPEERFTRVSPFAAAAMRLLLFTGCRVGEILNLRWEHVDTERGLLLLPDSKTGRKTVVLNAPALAVLGDLPRLGPYVVPGDNPGRPRADLKRPWQAVARRAGLSGVRLHDIRHTYASVGAAGGLGLPIIGKLLGHAQSATTARYAHLDNDPLRRASEQIAGRIADALGEPPSANRGRAKMSGSKARPLISASTGKAGHRQGAQAHES